MQDRYEVWHVKNLGGFVWICYYSCSEKFLLYFKFLESRLSLIWFCFYLVCGQEEFQGCVKKEIWEHVWGVGYWPCYSTVGQGIRELQAGKPKGFKSIYNLVTVYPVFSLLCWAEYLTENSLTYLKIIWDSDSDYSVCEKLTQYVFLLFLSKEHNVFQVFLLFSVL